MTKMDTNQSHQSILNFSKYFMVASGIWRLPVTKHSASAKIYALYSATIQTFYSIIAISFCVQFTLTLATKTDKNSDKLFKQSSYIITLVIIEYASIICQRSKMRHIMSFMIEEENKIFESKDRDVLDTYLGQLKFCRRTNIILFVFTCCSGATIVLENLLLQLNVRKHNKEFNDTLTKPLPLDLFYCGFDEKKHDTFFLVVHDIWLTNTMFLIVSTKTIVFTCIIFMPSILKKLQIKFRNLSSQGDDIWSRVRNLIIEHQTVIELVGKLNDSIKYLILLEYLLNSLNVATVSIQFITYEQKMVIAPIFYLSFLFVQTFILGWSANEIKVQSLVLSDALYDSPWYMQSGRIQKMLLTMMVRTQKPLVLTIGPFEAMTTQSALTVMKASYSYVSLMINSYDEQATSRQNY